MGLDRRRWRAGGENCRSVIAGDTAYGMLTLDALEPGDLSMEDKGLLRLMGGILAVALSVP